MVEVNKRPKNPMALRRSTGPAYGQIWLYELREVFILGNSIKDGLILSADRVMGERFDPKIDALSIFNSILSPQQELEELRESGIRWAC